MSAERPAPGGTAARRAARQADARAGTGPRGEAGPAPSATGAGKAGGGSARGRRAGAQVRRQLDPDALAALEEERDFLLRSLDDLEREHDAGDVDDTDYAELKDDYTARAAAVLRAIDDRHALAAATRPGRSWVRTATTLAVVAVLALGVGWFVFRDAGTRAPGGGLTGDARQDSANLILEANGFMTRAGQATDGETALENYRLALEAYGRALEISPANVEALTYRGWLYHTLALAAGEGPEADELDGYARADLAEAVALDPTYSDVRVFRAIMARNAGDFAAARAELDAVDPDDIPPYMANMLRGVQDDVDLGLTGTTTTTAP